MSRERSLSSTDRSFQSRMPNENPSARIRVLFVEDSRDCATAFQRVLGNYGIDVVIADSLGVARMLLVKRRGAIDAVLLDLHLPDGRGEDLLQDIEAISPQPGIVILSDYLNDIDPEATAYRPVLTPKTISPARLALILTRAAKGYAQSTLSRFAKQLRLTSKETDVLHSIVSGAAPKEVAMALECSVQAVYACLAKIDRKAGCECYQEVVAKLFQFSCHGLGHGLRFEDNEH